MADINVDLTGSGARTALDKNIDLRPTLFIGVGGTGMEVLMRVRRHILNALWGGEGSRTRVESLTDFPVAQFIHLDLDAGAIVDSGRAQADDLQFDLVKFTDEEKVVEPFDMEKYSRDEDTLEKYPHVKEWLPLTPRKLRELHFGSSSSGAGQIRAMSRLYFFDKYTSIRDKIRLKLKTLQAGLSHEPQLAALGLKMERAKFRIVVIGSVAGGTGSGCFLDMGYLCRWLARNEVPDADVELMMFLPSGYAGANKERTEANAYAALMELESAMLGNRGYIGRWDAYEQPELSSEPYKEVYLVDTGNLAQQHTKDIKDVYNMVADALFEDFASGDFARKKRSVAVNQVQHKIYPHDAVVRKDRFGDMRLSFSRRYSAFGQATLDTRQESHRDERAHRWAAEMLKAFFGVGAGDVGSNRSTDKVRDEFMASYIGLKPAPFTDFPDFSDKKIELKRSSGEFIDYFIVDELLQDRSGPMLAGVEQRVNVRIEEIRTGFDRKEWPAQVREAVKQLERDAVRDQDSNADVTEDRITKRRREILERIRQSVRDQLYVYLDNKEFGGLEYVLSLVEQIKDRLEATGVGVMAALSLNAERYREIKEAIRTREYERLLSNLEQTRGGFFGSGEKQAQLVMDHLRTEIANGIKFHLRAKAAEESALLMREVSDWLGKKVGVDASGRPVWNGLVAELQSGRQAVLEMLGQLQRANAILQQDLRTEHATLIYVPANERDVPLPGAAQLREWADEAFKDIGGSKKLFAMLGDSDDRNQILIKVKRMAERQIALAATKTPDADVDPLVEALDKLNLAARLELFRRLLSCALPWIDRKPGGDVKMEADRFKCFIGVANHRDFEKRFRSEIDDAIPPGGMTLAQVSIVETGIPGRAVCYCEISGVPLTLLRGLDGWRTSYRKESERYPVHTHIDSTQFRHPIEPSTDELNRLAEDFKQYLLAVMTAVLTRTSQRVVPLGQYQFAVARGDVRRIGNERAIRLNGLPATYREAIISRTQDLLGSFDAAQLIALYVLCEEYEKSVYTPILVEDETGAQTPRKGFASTVAAEAARDAHNRLRRQGLDSERIERASAFLRNHLDEWASPIPDSEADAYIWEVRVPDEDGKPRLKYAFNTDMLTAGKLEAFLAGMAMPIASTVAMPNPVVIPPPPVLGMPPGLSSAVAPPPLVEHQYFLGIGGKQYGPYPAAQIGQMIQARQILVEGTKVWRQGFASWMELGQVPELAAFVQMTAAPVPPPLK